MAFPMNANITAFVCRGRVLPKELYSQPRFKAGNAICNEITKPTNIATAPHIIVANIKYFTVLLSYLKC